MMWRRYLGLAIGEDGLQAVCLKKKGGRFQVAWAMTGLAGIQPTIEAPMLADPPTFADALRQLLAPLAGGEDRLGLSLPDACGRTLLLQLPTRPDSVAEEQRLLKWKLRDQLTCKPEEMRIAYTRLSGRDTSGCHYAVHAVREEIFSQLVVAVDRAGFQVDYAGFKAFNVWRQAVGNGLLGGRHLYVAMEGSNLSLLTATDRQLGACRSVTRTDSGELAAEIALTLSDWKRQKLIEPDSAAFLFSADHEGADPAQQLSSYIGRPVTPLTCPEGFDWSRGRLPNRPQRHSLTTAVAAAQLLAGA
jgi:hypothetical protein